MANMNPLVTVMALLLCSLHSNAVEITENGYPILWDKAQGLSELPSVDGTVVINPWDYLQRMGLYKLLINATEMYMTSMGPGTTENAMWSFPLQLAWILKSGRLVDPTNATLCGRETEDSMCISPKSWWACANYFLSVIPFLAAVETGIVAQGLKIQIQAPNEMAQDYCTSYSTCSTQHPETITKWVEFFQALMNLSTSDIPDLQKKDEILGYMWSAHLSSMLALSKCNPRLEYCSTPERTLTQNWINSADYVAAAHLQTNMETAKLFMSPLPSRVLWEGDSPPNIPDLSKEENHSLFIFSWMNSVNRMLGGGLVRLWRAAMCSEGTRTKGQAVLQSLLLDPKFAVSGFMSMLKEMTSSCFGGTS